jgi:hypothetical protein
MIGHVQPAFKWPPRPGVQRVHPTKPVLYPATGSDVV